MTNQLMVVHKVLSDLFSRLVAVTSRGGTQNSSAGSRRSDVTAAKVMQLGSGSWVLKLGLSDFRRLLIIA